MSYLKKGYTKTELLMSITIVSLVLVMAIPTLIQNIKKQAQVNLVKKAYVEFNQALKQMSTSKGCVADLKCSNQFDKGTTDKTLGDELVKYFKVDKNCGTTPDQGCFAAFTNENYDGSSSKVYELDNWAGYRFITADGMSFYVWNYAADCTENNSTGATGDLEESCGEIYVDVNGPEKGPNFMGIDTFNFWIANGKDATLYPMGGMDTKWGTEDWRWKNPKNGIVQNCYSGKQIGWPCAGRIVEEGWRMKY